MVNRPEKVPREPWEWRQRADALDQARMSAVLEKRQAGPDVVVWINARPLIIGGGLWFRNAAAGVYERKSSWQLGEELGGMREALRYLALMPTVLVDAIEVGLW